MNNNAGSGEAKPLKAPAQILEQELTEGLAEIQRSSSGLFISGLSAGLDLGFSVFLMATLLSLKDNTVPALVIQLMVAAAYSIGFIMVIIGRSELFTEHTTLAILPILNRRASLRDLIRLWGLVYLSNILGGLIFAALISFVGPALGAIKPAAFREIALPIVSHAWWVILLSGLLAGWLMGLLSWLVTASRDTVSQILLILLITTTIGLAHLDHSMAGSIEVLVGVFTAPDLTILHYLKFILWATIGNSIGGVFFVGVLKYAHAIRSSKNVEEVKVNTHEP